MYLEDLFDAIAVLKESKKLKKLKLMLFSNYFDTEHGEGGGPTLNL